MYVVHRKHAIVMTQYCNSSLLLNKAQREFVQSWNNHPIRTASHKSLLQLFTAGALLLQNSQLAGLDFFQEVRDDYGVDPDGPVPAHSDGALGVCVPESKLKFTDIDVACLQRNVDAISPSENYGIDLYEQTLDFICTLTPIPV